MIKVVVLLICIIHMASSDTVCGVLTQQAVEFGPFWTYANQEEWKESCKNGTFQSPINLAVQNVRIGDNKISLLCELANSNSVNNNYTIISQPNDYAIKVLTTNCDLQISNNAFDFNYNLNYFTIHMKSEHTINNQRFDGEIQMFFYLQDQFCNSTKDKIVALSVPFIDSGASVLDTPPLLTNISNYINQTTTQEKETGSLLNIRSDLMNQIGSNQVSYIQYTGSYTYPPCYETIQWLVMSEPLRVQSDVVSRLRLYNAGGTSTYSVANSNTRNIQDANERVFEKGAFWWYEDLYKFENQSLYDEVTPWVAVWAASVSPFILMFFAIIIYGLWSISINQKKELFQELRLDSNVHDADSNNRIEMVADKND